MKTKTFKVNVSITDLPLFISLDTLFAGLKAAGADGLEIVPGIKSRWRFSHLLELSKKHQLPISSMHQLPWSLAGINFDEQFVPDAKAIGVPTFVFHPLSRVSFQDPKMRNYLKKLASLKKKHKVTILLENMPRIVRIAILKKLLPLHSDTTDPVLVLKAAQEFGLDMTLDTSHLSVKNPANEVGFDKLFPHIGNIHLSSYISNKDHLPLTMGELDTPAFIKVLKKKNYQGLITLEIFYPRRVLTNQYNFEAIKRSIALVKAQ